MSVMCRYFSTCWDESIYKTKISALVLREIDNKQKK